MRPAAGFAVLVALMLAASPARAELLVEWGTPVDTYLTTSFDVELVSNAQPIFWQLGAFVSGFNPTAANVESWASNWRVFDLATNNYALGLFTGIAILLDDGTSSSTNATAGFDFRGLDAYMWGYNTFEDTADGTKFYGFGMEWLVLRADENPVDPWVFPVSYPPGPPSLEYEWSISDLTTNDVPLFGSQNGVIGLGIASAPINIAPVGYGDVLQLYTVVPEPSGIAAGILLVSGVGFYHWKRRRSKVTQES